MGLGFCLLLGVQVCTHWKNHAWIVIAWLCADMVSALLFSIIRGSLTLTVTTIISSETPSPLCMTGDCESVSEPTSEMPAKVRSGMLIVYLYFRLIVRNPADAGACSAGPSGETCLDYFATGIRRRPYSCRKPGPLCRSYDTSSWQSPPSGLRLTRRPETINSKHSIVPTPGAVLGRLIQFNSKTSSCSGLFWIYWVEGLGQHDLSRTSRPR